MLWSQVRVLSSILKLRHRIAAIAADCKSAVFRLRWFESNCLNKCSIRLTVRTQDFHSCNRGSIPRYCTKFLHGVYSSVGRVPDCGSGGRRFESVILHKFGSVAEWSNAPVLKTGVPQGTGGSNPSASANSNCLVV